MVEVAEAVRDKSKYCAYGINVASAFSMLVLTAT